jgi:hypothetical protein
MFLKQYVKRFKEECWALGFVRGGMYSIMESDHLDVDWVKMPHDRWFADPFVLDVTNEEILLLVEDFDYDIHKGMISLLHINRFSMEITSRKVLLELPTHLSFPAILRKDGHIYIYPENAQGGRLDMYEYDAAKEELVFVKTICDDVVWDSYITEAFGAPLMFTSAKNDYQLDIYKWVDKKERFVSYQRLASEQPNSRLGGAVYEYKGQFYYPAQENSKTYGGALDIKHIELENERVRVLETVKHIESPNKRYPIGLHTLNEYKGIVVIDVKGYRYGKIGSLVAQIVNLKKKLQ